MKAIKRVLCMLLSLLMVGGMTVIGASAVSGNLISGTVKLHTVNDSYSFEPTYYYSDDYFRLSGTISNEHLRSMSAIAAFSITNVSDDPLKDYGSIMENIGFTDLAAEELDVITADTIGTLIGRKTVNGVPVIAVFIRSDDYKNEWASNLQAGSEGDMSGFAKAAQTVTDRIYDYMIQSGMKKAKYWVTGYSRGGAVANLVGRNLNENAELFRTTADDIYVYTYEAPKCTDAPAAYKNIHNIVDSSDIIAQVYPGVWPAGRHGVDEEIGDLNETIMSKQFSIFEPHLADYKETNLSEFVGGFAQLFGENIDRQTYVELLQDHLSAIADMYFSLPDEEQKALLDFFTVVGNKVQNSPKLLLVGLNVLADAASDSAVEAVVQLLNSSIEEAVAEVGKPVGDEDFAKITDAIRPVVQAVMPVVKADTVIEDEDGNTVLFYHLSTFIANAGEIISHHYNYEIFQKLEAMDSFYMKREAEILGDVDGDGTVNVVDATCIQRSLVKLYVMDETAEKLADVDSDGEITVIDATWIMRFEAKMNVPEGIGKAI
ncbi:MAG: hypothetical protein IJV48_07015 [Ruminococcus sp.]|nr:hypothetical protein [Ruminococcus sp.]